MGSLSCKEYGTGPDCVMLLSGRPYWTRDLEPLAQALASSHRVLVVDMPGYGRSPALPEPYSLERSHELIEELMLGRGASEASLVGYSFGGYRALALALRGKVRPRALVALGGFAGYSLEERREHRALSDAVRAGGDLRELMAARLLAPAFAAAHPEARETVAGWLQATTPAVLAAEFAAASEAPDLWPLFHEIEAPVLARVGELDSAAPVSHSEKIARGVHRGFLEIVPGVGHAIFLEDAEATIASVVRFLARPG